MKRPGEVVEERLETLRSALAIQNPEWNANIVPAQRTERAVREQLTKLVGAAPAELVSWFRWKLGPDLRDSSSPIFLDSHAFPLGDERSVDYQNSFSTERRIVLLRSSHRLSYAQVDSGSDRVKIYNHNLQDSPTFAASSLADYVQYWTEFLTKIAVWDSATGGWTGGEGLPEPRSAEVIRVVMF